MWYNRNNTDSEADGPTSKYWPYYWWTVRLGVSDLASLSPRVPGLHDKDDSASMQGGLKKLHMTGHVECLVDWSS